MSIKLLVYKLKYWYHLIKTGWLRGFPAQLKYGFPARKLTILTITGTDGKTTSSTMLYHILKESGYPVALLSTVAAYVGNEEIDTGLHVTSPDPRQLHKILRDMVRQGVKYVVLEVTSHGAYQQRVWGIKPELAGVTNITNEHLDYHVSYQEYLKAKAIILKKARKAFINADDSSHGKLHRLLKQAKVKTHSYSAQESLFPKIKTILRQKFPEAYNQQNGILVYHMAKELGVSNADFIKHIATFPGVKGRMQSIPNNLGLRLIVDFAHTPNGLLQALTALRESKTSSRQNLIAVYGAAGLRDFIKRPVMGKVGAELADLVVLTAEDPRTENLWSIIRQMKDGVVTGHHKVISIADRREAIEFAIKKLAKKGDIVAIFGKGHEQSMCYGTTEFPWSDIDVAKQLGE